MTSVKNLTTKQKQELSNMHNLAKITMSMGYDFTKKCNIFMRTKKSFFPPVGRTNIGPIAVLQLSSQINVFRFYEVANKAHVF